MLPKIDSASALPVAATALLRSTASVADPRLDAMVRLDQIAFAPSLPRQLGGKAIDAAGLTPAQAAALSLANPAPTAQTTLSAAGRLIDSLLNSSVDTQQPKTLQSALPLVIKMQADSTQLTKQLTTQLHTAVTQSGVFYDSHLKQWSEGERTLLQVQAEPQNQPRTLPAELAAQWVPAQLNALEQQRFQWHGEVWPGQAMQWEVKEDTSEPPQTPEGETQAAWKSVLQLDFPGLGKVNATLRLVGEHVQVQLRAQEITTAATLKSQGDRLGEALAASGTTLDGLTVQRDELT